MFCIIALHQANDAQTARVVPYAKSFLFSTFFSSSAVMYLYNDERILLGGIYDEIYPEPEEFAGSDYIYIT